MINHDNNYKRDFLNEHKTIIVCNGGNNAMIRQTIEFFKHPKNIYPWHDFYEDEQSLDSALTGVGIILPECIYNAEMGVISKQIRGEPQKFNAAVYKSCTYKEYSFEYDLIKLIKSFPLAK